MTVENRKLRCNTLMIIRKAMFTDIEEILDIENESIDSWTYDQFVDELGKNYSVILVADSGDRIAGYVCAWIVSGDGEITSFAVKKNLRGNGTGAALLSRLEEIFLEENTESVFLEVRSKNSEAISFYTRHGFEVKGARKKYYIDDDALLMEKKLK